MDAVEEPEFGRNDGNDAENCAVLNEWRDGEATNRGAVSDLEAIADKPTGGDLDARDLLRVRATSPVVVGRSSAGFTSRQMLGGVIADGAVRLDQLG